MATAGLTPGSRAAFVFGSALALRLALFHLPALSPILASQVEISTPITSFKRLVEGVFLYRSGVPPYDGGVFHQTPLLLGLFYPIIDNPLAVKLLYSLVDLAVGYMLLQITAIKDRDSVYEKKILQYGNKVEEPGMSGLTVASLYLFNPYTLASCLGKSTILFTNAAVIAGIWMGMKRNRTLAIFSITLATYFSFYPAMLIIPVVLMLTRGVGDVQVQKSIAMQCTVLFTLSLGALFLLSYVLVDTWDFFESVYGTILKVSDLTPNLGLFWYFFIEMFDQFRSFFLVVFQFHVFIFAVPISIKLCSEIFKYMRYTFLIVNLFIYATFLAPIFWYLWVYVGSGNANFFYAIGLVYGIGEIILMIDTTYAVSRRDFELQSPPATSDDPDSAGWDREVVQK
ncbi:hypothetical protein EDD11_007962 [Mortierella claussenii]|nr:hypothetical protein EDD11_007962 [Mortierella claussenii]